MIDKYDKGTIDIFDPEHWHPANKPAKKEEHKEQTCLLYTSPSPRDRQKTRMPSSA